MHDIEYGHDCPRCNRNSRCFIEDGFCENGGTCDSCIKEQVYEEMEREFRGDTDYDG